MEQKNEKKQKTEYVTDPFEKLQRRVVNLTPAKQFQLIKTLIKNNREDKEFMQSVYSEVRKSPSLEIEVAGEELLMSKIKNWMEARLRNFKEPPEKMPPVRLADECQSYYLKTWKKTNYKTGEKEPTVKGLAKESKKKFKTPLRMWPLLMRLARQAKDRDRKRREKSKKDSAMQGDNK